MSNIGVINLSVVRFQLVHSSVQVPTQWWSKSSRGLIGAQDICFSFIDITLSIERATVNSFVVYTILEFVLGVTQRSSIQNKFCQELSIWNHILSALSPALSPLKVEILDSVQLLAIIFIYLLKNKFICSYTSEFFHFYFSDYLVL